MCLMFRRPGLTLRLLVVGGATLSACTGGSSGGAPGIGSLSGADSGPVEGDSSVEGGLEPEIDQLPSIYDGGLARSRQGIGSQRVEIPAVVGDREIMHASAVFIVPDGGPAVRIDDRAGEQLPVDVLQADLLSRQELTILTADLLGNEVSVEGMSRYWWPEGEVLRPVSELEVFTPSAGWYVVWDEATLSPLLVVEHGPVDVGEPGCSPVEAGEACVWAPDPETTRRLEGSPQRTVALQNLETPGVLSGRFATVYVENSRSQLWSWLASDAQAPPVMSGPLWDDATRERAAGVNAYYWIDHVARKLDRHGWRSGLEGPVAVVPFESSVTDNAVFHPFGPHIYFGRSDNGHAVAEDAQVVIHEYAHALFDAAAPRMLTTERRAYNEASADLIAVLNTVDLGLRDPPCVGPWYRENAGENSILSRLGVRDPGCLRRLDVAATYPDDVNSDPYITSRIWAGGVWDIFVAEVQQRGGTLRECRRPSVCASAADDVFLTLVESWHHLQAGRFTLFDAATAFISANERLRLLVAASLQDKFADRGLRSGDDDFNIVYGLVAFASPANDAYGLNITVESADGTTLCEAAQNEVFNPGGSATRVAALEGCTELLPPSPERVWVLSVTTKGTPEPGRIVQFSLETRSRIYRAPSCGIDLGPSAGSTTRLEITSPLQLQDCYGLDESEPGSEQRSRSYRVAYVEDGQNDFPDGIPEPSRDLLNVRADASASSPVVATLEPGESGVQVTGPAVLVGSSAWVPVDTSDGAAGWVNRRFLVRDVVAEEFCDDPGARRALDNFVVGVQQQDDALLHSVTDSGRGVWFSLGGAVPLEPVRVSATPFADPPMEWYRQDGTGDAVFGTFDEVARDRLTEGFADLSDVACNSYEIGSPGGNLIALARGHEYANYFSIHRSGPTSNPLDWSTLVVGMDLDEQDHWVVTSVVRFRWGI